MVYVAHFKQTLWLHRRFLSMCWINNFLIDSGDGSDHSKEATSMYHDFGTFLQNELCLLHSSTFVDDDFGDFQAQATYAASYILWLKVVCEFFFISLSILRLLSWISCSSRLKYVIICASASAQAS